MTDELNRRLGHLLDKQDVEEAILKYARGIDRMDEALIRSVLHDDAVFEHFDLPGGRLVGGAEIAAQTMILGAWIKGGSHFLPQTLIELDGDTAYAETYALTCVVTGEAGAEQEQQVYVRGIRLFHRMERREGGEWKIAYRTGRHDGFELRQPLPSSPYDRSDPAVAGQKDGTDLLYHLKEKLRLGGTGQA
jgi:ketosteroid isomerase-like protein